MRTGELLDVALEETDLRAVDQEGDLRTSKNETMIKMKQQMKEDA